MCMKEVTSPLPALLPTLFICDSSIKLEYFLKQPPPFMPKLKSLVFLVTSVPLEEITSIVDPSEFSEVIGYYFGLKNAHKILAEKFPDAHIVVYELADGHVWPPSSRLAKDEPLIYDDTPFTIKIKRST